MTTERRPVVVVTGGGAGIGREIVQLYRARGVHVVTCSRSAAEMEEPGLTVLAADVASASDRERLVRAARARGRVVGLVNNAAVQRAYALTRGAAHARDLEEEIAINLLAPLALGHLLAEEIAASGGFIANVSSGLAYVPIARSPVYAATKAGLSQYTRSARRQRPALRMVEVVLPLVDTAMTRGRGRGKISPEEAARQIVEGLDAGRETIRVGKARWLPWLLRLAPSAVAWLLNRPS